MAFKGVLYGQKQSDPHLMRIHLIIVRQRREEYEYELHPCFFRNQHAHPSS
jgi:hypothetical protein